MIDFSRYCLNKHHNQGLENTCYCGRGSDWGNPLKRSENNTRQQNVQNHEFWLSRNPTLLKRIDELRGKRLLCFCAPKLCHTYVLTFLANSGRPTRIRWWTHMHGLTGPRTISDNTAWERFTAP